MVYQKVKRRGKSKNIEEVQKSRGFMRGFDIDCILSAATTKEKELMFLIKWIGCDELDLLQASEVNERCPETVISYYESLSPINRRFEVKEKERLALALRPVIVSKVEHMMSQQNETVSNEELFRAVVQEATAEEVPAAQEEVATGMVQIPQEDSAMVQMPEGFNADMPSLIQQDEMNWVGEEQIIGN